MKRELKYIRHKICRSIYYADHCPMDNKKNYKEMFVNAIAAFGLCVVGLAIMILLCLMGF